jgi:GAF domain-containing protein
MASELIANVQVEVDRMAASSATPEQFMTFITELLNRKMLKYNWVGFYMLDETPPETMLVLGPFVGSMTPHTRIPLHQGICGAAASTGQTVVVDDVNKDPRYLACSIETKSEIVVPVFVKGKVVGELDIDSHYPAAFTPADRDLVEYCAVAVGRFIEKSGQAYRARGG